MAYEPYINETYYQAHGKHADVTQAELVRASRDIDALTYCRIKENGFSELTPEQQEIVQEVAVGIVDFIKDGGDMLTSGLSSYSINGVSMSFDKDLFHKGNGVLIPIRLYENLKQTGLCWRGL